MAKIKQGILGGFSGKVANVVGTSWKGRAVMKSQPLSVANPRTESQVGQRNKFSKVAELASAILTQFVQPVENPISGNISGYNLFCKDNKVAFDAAGDFDGANLVCGGGKIINLESPNVAAKTGATKGKLTWTNSVGISALRLTDKVYAVLLNEDGKAIGATSGSSARAAEDVDINLFDGETMGDVDDTFYVLYAVVSADGRDVSVKTTAVSGAITA